MPSLSIPLGDSFVVNSTDSITYNNELYTGVSQVVMGDGSIKTLAELIDENGGLAYDESDLISCVKVEGYDPAQNNRQVFTAYSNNSAQTSKNETASVPGGLWVEMFNFLGDKDGNYILKMWDDAGKTGYSTSWIGFRINYGISDANVYVLTWINDLLEESQPCPPAEIGITYMHYCKVYGKFQPPAPITDGAQRPHPFVPIRSFGLYRSNATKAGTAIFQKVPLTPVSVAPNPQAGADIPMDVWNPAVQYGFEYHDDVAADKLLEPLPSTDWTQPPYRAMRGLTAWRNGMMAAYNRNTIMFCEPYRPFAWPTVYYRTLPFDIVALAVQENSLLAITTGDPYVFVGSHPANVQYERLENVQAGLVAKPFKGHAMPSRAVAETPSGVIYASSEGPVVVAGGRAQLLGRQLFTREEWQRRYRSGFQTMRMAYSDGQVVAYFPDADGLPGFKMTLAEADPQFVKYQPAVTPTADFVLPDADRLYVIKPYSTTQSSIAEFQSELVDRVEARYWTREIHLAKPESLGAVEVRGYGGTVRVEVFDASSTTNPLEPPTLAGPAVTPWSQRAALYDKTFTLGEKWTAVMGRLPSGYKSRNYSVRLTLGTNTVVKELLLASTPLELAGG